MTQSAPPGPAGPGRAGPGRGARGERRGRARVSRAVGELTRPGADLQAPGGPGCSHARPCAPHGLVSLLRDPPIHMIFFSARHRVHVLICSTPAEYLTLVVRECSDFSTIRSLSFRKFQIIPRGQCSTPCECAEQPQEPVPDPPRQRWPLAPGLYLCTLYRGSLRIHLFTYPPFPLGCQL